MNNIFKSSTKITQNSRKIHILRLKTVTASVAPSGPQTPCLQTNVSRTKPILKNKFVKMPKSFILKKIFYVCTYINLHQFLKKKCQEKWENAYLRVKNARASRALRQALDPQPILAHFACLTLLCYIGKISEKILGPPLTKS